jgi:hypothetical protein
LSAVRSTRRVVHGVAGPPPAAPLYHTARDRWHKGQRLAKALAPRLP